MAARIGFPEVKLGVFPGSGGVFRLPRVAGPAKAYELICSGMIIDAAEALRTGLVNRLTPKGKALTAALEFVENLARGPALALSLIRAGIRDSLHQTTLGQHTGVVLQELGLASAEIEERQQTKSVGPDRAKTGFDRKASAPESCFCRKALKPAG